MTARDYSIYTMSLNIPGGSVHCHSKRNQHRRGCTNVEAKKKASEPAASGGTGTVGGGAIITKEISVSPNGPVGSITFSVKYAPSSKLRVLFLHGTAINSEYQTLLQTGWACLDDERTDNIPGKFFDFASVLRMTPRPHRRFSNR